VNVRSLPRSPEDGGLLLPFRGHTDCGGNSAPEGDVPRVRASRGTEEATPAVTTVVHLTGRRRASTATSGDTGGGRDWVRAAVVVAFAVVVVAGATAAALTGVLPVVTERPVPRPAVSAPPTVAGAEGTNAPAAYRLCKAFDRAAERGDDVATSVAFRNLAHAAGGASKVSTYCAPFDDIDRGRAQ
jgi:hypothetical protein